MGLHDRTGRKTLTSSRALWTEAEPEEVRRWFRDWLTSHGWKVDSTSTRLSTLISKEATRLPADQAASIAGLTMDGFLRGKEGFTLMVFPSPRTHRWPRPSCHPRLGRFIRSRT